MAGPFTVRDLTVFGSIVVLLIGSVIPLFVDFGNGYSPYINLWSMGSTAQVVVFGLMLPLVVGALFIARRLSGKDEVLRIGSLSLDQFASVVASVATVFHFLSVASFFQAGPIIALIGALGLLVATVGGPHIPVFAADFTVRPSVEARLVARPAEADAERAEQVTEETPAGTTPATSVTDGNTAPRALASPDATIDADADAHTVTGVPAEDTEDTEDTEERRTTAEPDWWEPAGQGSDERRTGSSAVSPTIGAVVDPDEPGHGDRSRTEERQEPFEAFWFAVAYPRPTFDERTGAQRFMLEPGAWILALQDRGNAFLVQHTDGRTAVLHDLNSIERA
ncbi:hypothetical protein BKD30_02555 [Tersicoccus phoenicis]|uniref:Uncharacterized protein n=1 Tax=Tersicoccus phoenicis TaxID=554083 RepID=A0A1R1LJ75_9MICC|nr:hypothetical protein [Tersicoccus phoenicis]OMH27560.1 hypothetical protein BKD30_02555 [Tersicoccus phoenicis]